MLASQRCGDGTGRVDVQDIALDDVHVVQIDQGLSQEGSHAPVQLHSHDRGGATGELAGHPPEARADLENKVVGREVRGS